MKRPKFGFSFTDEVQKAAGAKHTYHKIKERFWQDSLIGGRGSLEENQTQLLSPWRKIFLVIIFILIISALVLRLFKLQVVEGKNNRDLADSNRIQIKIIHAPRGVIYDRSGKILAQNEPGFRLLDPTHPEKKAQYLSRDKALELEIKADPNFKNLEVDNLRSYPLGEKTAHILGYVGEITQEELKKAEYQNYKQSFTAYKAGDKIGRGGVEQTYEKILKGVDGGEVVEVDSSGKNLRSLTKTDAVPGQNLYLSIDADLQQLAYNQLLETTKKVGSCCGSVVAQSVDNGQILALVSLPSYDPQDLAKSLTDPHSPLLNRVIAGTYPPGSTFKIASSLAGLASGKITRFTSFEDTGVLHLGEFSFANWYFTEYGRKEGMVDVLKALQRSNDIFFYHVGQITGVESLADSAKKLGLGEVLGIDIPSEAKGLIPNSDWKEQNFDEPWYPGDTLHMAIGQGYVLVTPLQINYLLSTIATSGNQYPPHLALKITDPHGGLIKEFKYDPLQKPPFKQSDLDLVRQGLELVPKYGGTAWPLFTFPIPTAGKTGTAEFGEAKKTHAWYTGYGPADKPKIAITVLVEGGGEGSTVAAPIVKEMFRYYLSTDKKNLIKDVTIAEATSSARTLGE